MPCACLLPPEIYPDASEWGPHLWTILHGIAEKAGTPLFPQYYADERRTLIKLFHALGKMIPCPSCKEHFEVYLREHPVDRDLKELPQHEVKNYVRVWFWELHNWVNESLSRPEFPFDQLTPSYGGININTSLKSLDIPMRRAIRVRSGQLLAYTEFLKQVKLLLSVY